MVSTHSRTKAAAFDFIDKLPTIYRFNTQPHEGGCLSEIFREKACLKFQHTAARRRLHTEYGVSDILLQFQHTAARRRLPNLVIVCLFFKQVSTHSRTKAAARKPSAICGYVTVSTHSRTKAAACPNCYFRV